MHLPVKSSFSLGIITLPELKISLKKPIDRCKLGLTYDTDQRLIRSIKLLYFAKHNNEVKFFILIIFIRNEKDLIWE